MTTLYRNDYISTNPHKFTVSSSDYWNIYCLSWIVNSSTNSNCSSASSRTNCQIILWPATSSVGNWSLTSYHYYIFNNNINSWDNKFFWCFNLDPSLFTPEYIAIYNWWTTNNTNVDIDYEIMKRTPENNNWWWQQQCDYTDYELKSNITENYCKNKFNNLIDENDCNCENEWENECTWWIENWTGEINWSSIFINNIQHNWAWLINITIPEEIERDYTNQDNEINVDVLWYWYDQEKMQSMVNTQYYTPTPEDMNKLIWKIADFLPLMAIVLLVCYAWRLIKKIF